MGERDVPELARKGARRRRRIGVPEITEWCRMVERGTVASCREQRDLVAHVRRTFAEEELWVDRERLGRYLSYERYFPFSLAPEERFCLALWLCTYRSDGFPRWPDLFLYVCRGFGKTAFAAFCAFCLIGPANGIASYDVDICATTEEQAQLGYLDLWNTFEARPDLFRQAFDWNKVEMTCRSTRSRFKYWSGNSSSKDGMRSGAVFFDEIHAFTDSASMEVFTGGLGKKPDARRLLTTTDGDIRDGVLDELKATARAILAGEEPDGGMLPFMCKLDSPDEIDDERLWPKANPRLYQSRQLLEEYRKNVREWRRSPDRHTSVPTKRFNLPTARKDVQVTSWENLLACSRPPGELGGRACVVGIDYAKTTDMVGACLLFRDGDGYAAVIHGWWCTRSSDAGEVKAPLGEWADMGVLTIVDDVEVPPSAVAEWVREACGRYDVRCVAMDSYRVTLFKDALAKAGFDTSDKSRVYLTRPSDDMRVQPVIDSAFANRAIAWGDNPLARWAANNAKLEPAPNENFRYGKIERRGRKTDPFMAMVHAFAVADRLPEDAPVAFLEPIYF